MANEGKAPRPGGVEASYRPDETPLSSSAVVIRRAARASDAPRRRRLADSEAPYDLTPYQARLDIEMDDTAISKVRDPSVSLLLGADGALQSASAARGRRSRHREAIFSVALGTLIGALLVVAAVLVARIAFQ